MHLAIIPACAPSIVVACADGSALRPRAAGIAAKKNFTDHDIVNFLTNVECLEGLFDTWGTFGVGTALCLPEPLMSAVPLHTEALRGISLCSYIYLDGTSRKT